MTKISMRDCIEMTPQVVRAQMESFRALTGGLVNALISKPWRRVVIVASGSSYTASQCVRQYLVSALGVPVQVMFPYTFTNYEQETLTENDFVLVVSQSGGSANCVDALAATSGRQVVARLLTTQPACGCARVADEVYDWGVGEEAVGYVTFGPISLATYLLQVGALVQDKRADMDGNVTGAYDACADAIARAMEHHSELLARTDAFVAARYRELMQMDRVYVLGCGSNYGTALEGALKIGETVKTLAVGYEQDEFLHGPALQLNPRYTVFVIDGGDVTTEHARRVFQAVDRVTANVYLIKPETLCSADEAADSRVMALPGAADGCEAYSFLYALPVFQVIASTLSHDLDSLRSHPLYYEMNRMIDFRTEEFRINHPADDD